MLFRPPSPFGPLTLLLILLGLAGPALGLQGQIEQLIQASDYDGLEIAVFVRDLERDRTLVSMRADRPMIPASNMKLLSTAAALDVLGPDHVFETELAMRTSADEQQADLLVRGGGDPAFGDPVLLERHDLSVEDLLDTWVEQVRQTGRDRFDRLLIDDRLFDREFTHPHWPEDQLINHWCAQVAGLNFYRNTIDVRAEPTAIGQAPDVRIFPPAPFLQTRNQASTGRSNAFWISRKPGTNELTFRGTVHHNMAAPVRATVHDPPLFFGRLLAHQLGRAGISVGEVQRVEEEADLAGAEPLHVVRTTLPLVLERTNQNSVNMFAEALVKAMGQATTGNPGSWSNGAAAMRMAFRQRLGPQSAQFIIADGSGMSRENRITARLMGQLLESFDEDPLYDELFRQSLAQPGESGTLSNRLRDLDGRVHAKTGYIRGVSALSGYLTLPSANEEPGRRIVFSIIINGFQPPLRNADMRDFQDELVRLVEEHARVR